MLNVVE